MRPERGPMESRTWLWLFQFYIPPTSPFAPLLVCIALHHYYFSIVNGRNMACRRKRPSSLYVIIYSCLMRAYTSGGIWHPGSLPYNGLHSLSGIWIRTANLEPYRSAGHLSGPTAPLVSSRTSQTLRSATMGSRNLLRGKGYCQSPSWSSRGHLIAY
jgi:hypothetical protein